MTHVDPDLSAGLPPRPSVFWTIVLIVVLIGALHAIAPELGVAALVLVLVVWLGSPIARALRRAVHR